MPKIKVRVKDGIFPLRYNGERHEAGAVVSIDDKHFNESVFEKVGSAKDTAEKTE